KAAGKLERVALRFEPCAPLRRAHHGLRVPLQRREFQPVSGDERLENLMRRQPDVVTGPFQSQRQRHERLYVATRAYGEDCEMHVFSSVEGSPPDAGSDAPPGLRTMSQTIVHRSSRSGHPTKGGDSPPEREKADLRKRV